MQKYFLGSLSVLSDDVRENEIIFFLWVVFLAAVFSLVTQRSSPQTAAHIRTTFLTATLTNHHSGYICRELCTPKWSNQSYCLFNLGVQSFQNGDLWRSVWCQIVSKPFRIPSIRNNTEFEQYSFLALLKSAPARLEWSLSIVLHFVLW